MPYTITTTQSLCHFISVCDDMKSSQWFLMLLQHSVSPSDDTIAALALSNSSI